ncbi:MAG: hypothetical protein IJP98_06150 [Clostridia bacterium]|nr:hypothetical protein [Clostridia bacterium]
MIFIGILMILLGCAFGAMGYMIAFQNKYALINHFIEDRHSGKLDNAYARRTGLLEILWGFLSLLLGILVLCIRSVPFTWTVFCIVLLGTAATLVVHTLLSIRKAK